MYKLYTDKNESFECDVSVKNASFKNSVARIVVESDGMNVVFNGTIDSGRCKVPIKKMNGILSENQKGKMFLEIIVEGTYFRPWESEYVVEEHTSVKVAQIQEQQSKKPDVVVSVKEQITGEPKTIDYSSIITNELKGICERFDINKDTIKSRREDIREIIKEYFKSNPEYVKYKSAILKDLKKLL